MVNILCKAHPDLKNAFNLRSLMLLRLFTGVILGLVAVIVLKGVDVLATEMFSDSESVSWSLVQAARFLLKSDINLSIFF